MASPLKTRGVSFPFRRGTFAFPEQNSGPQTVIDSVRSLLLTGQGEVPMAPSLGTNIHSFVFTNLTPLQQARIAQSIRTTIAQKEPRMDILSVEVVPAGDESSGYRAEVNIVYKVADEVGETSIPVV